MESSAGGICQSSFGYLWTTVPSRHDSPVMLLHKLHCGDSSTQGDKASATPRARASLDRARPRSKAALFCGGCNYISYRRCSGACACSVLATAPLCLRSPGCRTGRTAAVKPPRRTSFVHAGLCLIETSLPLHLKHPGEYASVPISMLEEYAGILTLWP